MKTLFRIAVILFVLLIVALVGGYFTLTNPGFQKGLVEGQLPAGSSIESIHVTTSKVSLSGLVLQLEDGTRVQVGSVDTAFEPLAAAFDQTIKAGVLRVEGLRVDLPDVAPPTASSGQAPPSSGTPEAPSDVDASAEPAGNPIDLLTALGDFEWLFDIEGIEIEGVIYDGKGSQYIMRVDSPAIRPGEASQIAASLQLLTDTPLPSGLKTFDANATLSFKQKATGGFESLKFESDTSGKDQRGSQLISVQQALDLAVDDAAGEAIVSVTFDANLPKPQVLASELESLGALAVSGNAVAVTNGEVATLNEIDLTVSVAGSERLALDLKQPLLLGGTQVLSGELLDLSIRDLPLEWLNPWLGDELRVQSQAPLSLDFSVTGTAEGAYVAQVVESMTLGPLSVTDGGTPLLQDIIVTLAPQFQLNADQSLQYTLDSLSVADRYGSFMQGKSSGVIRLDAERNAMAPFAGVQSRTELQIGLQELFQLPVLASSASIVSGQLDLNLNVDDTAKQPLQLSAKIDALRARSLPTVARDYSVQLGLSPTSDAGEWQIQADVLAGVESRPSTALKLQGEVNANQEPLTFTVDLSGPRVTQEDISILSAAFTPREEVIAPPTPSLPGTKRSAAKPRAGVAQKTDVPDGPVPPPWAMLDGHASIAIDEVRLESGHVIEAVAIKATVSEPMLLVEPISAKVGSGAFNGTATVLYAEQQTKPYRIDTKLGFDQLNPAYFAKPHQTPPVAGKFDGTLEIAGAGVSLEHAAEDSTVALKITGKDGILTAFELDSRQQMGLGLAGLLGKSLDRPGISALSHTIPYFKDIPFDHFVFELTRGADKRVKVPQMRLTGQSLLLDASGSVGPSAFSEVMDQPIDLTLSLGAKGQLTEYLETLNLLQPTVGEDGFTRWNEDVEITGTLADPDTDGLMDLLNDAAKGVLSKSDDDDKDSSESEGGDSAEPKEKSKEERRRDEIEAGLDLINSFFN